MFLFAAGYPHFLHHPVQTGALWRLCFPSLGSGGRLGHCHGLYHLDSFGCHSHTVGVTWLHHAGDIHLPFILSLSRLYKWYPCACVAMLCSYVVITGTFLPQKLKLSITPYSLNETSKKPYHENEGNRAGGYPVIAVTGSISKLDKLPIETNFWYCCVFCTTSVYLATSCGWVLVS